VFWCNEVAQVANLAQKGILAPYESPAAKDIPPQWCDPQHRWHGFAARARILIVNTELLPDPASWPKSYLDLADPKWKGRCAVAAPLLGTTLTHFTALRLCLGDGPFDEFVAAMFGNDVRFLAGNGATMRAVRDGQLAWAFTDTDDYHVAMTKGHKVACVFPDQQEGGIGTMLIPNAVGLVAGGPDPAGAKRLIDAILSRETEGLLALADGAQIPLRNGVPGPKDPAIKVVGQFRPMAWDSRRSAPTSNAAAATSASAGASDRASGRPEHARRSGSRCCSSPRSCCCRCCSSRPRRSSARTASRSTRGASWPTTRTSARRSSRRCSSASRRPRSRCCSAADTRGRRSRAICPAQAG
jgi:iron(III) transport system substrate-binding protein